MNNLVRSLAAFALVLAALLPRSAFALDTGDIVVESIKGEVRITMQGAAATVRAGGVLELPATIDTGRDGAIELRQGATTISVGPETKLEFPALEKRGGSIDRVVQPRGNAFYNIGKREGRRLRVETPYLVGVIKGTQFNVAAQDGATTISLFEGLLEVHASDDSSVVDLKAGEIASRKRGDKSINVIKMDAGKAPPAQRAPASSNGSNGGNPAPGTSRPAPVVSGDPVFGDRGNVPGAPVSSSLAEIVRAPVDASVDVGVRGNEPGASVAAGVDLNAASLNVDVAASVGASSGVDVGAGAADNLGSAGVDVGTGVNLNASGVDATVNAGVNLGGAVDAGVDAAVNVGGGAVDVGVAVNVDAGPAAVDVGTAANVDLGAGAVDVGVAVNVDAGPAAVDVGTAANVDLGAGAVDVATNVAVDAGPLATDVNVGAAVDVVPGNVAANVDLGTSVDVGSVAAVDTGVGAAVDLGTNVDVAANVDVGANVAGVNAGVNAGADLGSGTVNVGVNLGGLDLGVNLDLGLDDKNNGNGNNTSHNDTSNPGNTPDLGAVLDGLLGRGKKKK